MTPNLKDVTRLLGSNRVHRKIANDAYHKFQYKWKMFWIKKIFILTCGGSRGGPNCGPKGRPAPPPPLSQGLDDRALPPYLQVWIHHCLPCSYFVHFRPWYRALLFLLTHSSWKVRQNSQSCVQRLFNSVGESAVELQSSLLTEFSKLLSTQKVSKGWIFLHFSLPDNGNYGLSTWIFWTFCSFKGLQRLPSICSTELELMLKQCRVTV